MPIPVQDIIDQMRADLDAEGQDYYGDLEDMIPAINGSIKWLVNIINQALGEDKSSEEALEDLATTLVFITSTDSRISLDVFPDAVWTIIGVYPKIVTGTTGNPYTPPATDLESAQRTDLYFKNSPYSCKRLTSEEWNDNTGNPFEAGNTIVDSECSDILDFAYVGPKNYGNGQGKEIEIRPYVPRENVAIEYCKPHPKITATTDTILFPESLFQIITNKALKYIAYQQGDGTSIYNVTSEDIQELINSVV